jgi:hypothetical protein
MKKTTQHICKKNKNNNWSFIATLILNNDFITLTNGCYLKNPNLAQNFENQM